MALNKVYSRINWENSPSTKTALNEDNLNRIDYAVNEIDNRVLSLDTTKSDKSETLQLLAGWTMDEKTGIITVTKKNGDKLTFDLNVEKVPVDFALSADGILTMMTADGTKFSADIGSMIPVMTFQTSDTIAVSVTGSGQEKTYSFSVKPGSITEDKLQPNYLADVRTAASAAQKSAQAAKGSEDTVKADADRASAAATAAEASKTAAAKSQTAAKASQDAAKASETASAASKVAAETAAATATQKAVAASNSAATATQKEASAVKAASDALSSARTAEANAQTATDSSIEAKSYAIGGTGTRIGEDADNAKYYCDQAKLQANVPTKLSQLQNDTGFITVAVDNLVHYYTSSQLYTKSEVDQKLSTIPKFAIVAVTALPTANISSTTIYLLKEGNAGTNKCSEWVYVSGAWEKLGDIDVDLSGYLTKTGDGSSLTAAFTEAPTLATINTGEKFSVIMGKVKKAITALLSHTGTAATSSVSGHVKVDSAMSSTSTNPVQNKVVNTALAGKLATTGNASNTTVAYTEAADLTELASGEKQSVAFGKLKLAVKNVISIVKLLGSTDISAIGGGTVTGAISSLNSNLINKTTGFKGVLTATEINDASISVSYTGDINPATADELGIAHGWWAIAHMAHASSDGYCAQVVYPYTAADVPRYRNCYAGTWSKWSAIGDGWIDLTPQCTFYVALQPSPAFGSWIKYNISTRELKGVIETTSDIKNQQIIVNFPAQLPGLCGINTFTGVCGMAVNGTNNTDPYLRIMPRVQGGAIISSHTRDEIVHGATYMISFIAQC